MSDFGRLELGGMWDSEFECARAQGFCRSCEISPGPPTRNFDRPKPRLRRAIGFGETF